MVRGDDIGVGRHLFDLALAGIGHTGEEINEPPGHILVGGLQIQHHRPLVLKLVGDLGRIFKAVRLHQHYLQLCSSVDIHNLIAAILRLVAALVKGALTGLLQLLIFLILIVVRMGQLLQLIQNAHDGTS